MRLNWLESFVAFSELRNFTHAAERLHLSQPALHEQIRRLAADLGVSLYVRRGRELALTADGRRVAAFARSMLGQVGDLRGELTDGVARRPVVVSGGRATHLHLLAAPLRAWVSDGDRTVRVRTESREETIEALLSGTADLGVAPLDMLPPDLDTRPIATVATTCVVPPSHPLAERRRLRLSDLDGCDLILPPPDRPHHATVMSALREANARASVAIEAGGWELMVHYASLGLGVAVVNDICPLPDGVRAIPLQGLPRLTYHVAIARGSYVSPRARELFDHLVGWSWSRRVG